MIISGHIYLYLIESVRSHIKQCINKDLGRKDKVLENGDLERIVSSVCRYSEGTFVGSAFGKDEQIGRQRAWRQ